MQDLEIMDVPAVQESPTVEIMEAETHAALSTQQAVASQSLFQVQHMGLHQGLGMFRAFEFITSISSVAKTRWLRERHESGDYKGVQVQGADGSIKTLQNFADLCAAAGVSLSKAKEDMQNLALFGEQFMASAEQAGLGYRQLRNLRKLDEASREEVLGEAAKTDDPNDLRWLIEDAYEAKAKMRKELDEAKANYEASKEVSAKTRDKLDKAERELSKLKALPDNAKASQRIELRRDVLEKLGRECTLFVGGLPRVIGLATQLIESAREDADHEVVAMVTEKMSELCAVMGKLMEDAGIDVSFEAIMDHNYEESEGD